MTFYEKMTADYQTATEAFQKEEAELQKKKGELRASIDYEFNRAKISVLTREAEQATVEKKPKVVDSKKVEILAIQEGVEKIKAEVQKIDDRLTRIEDEKKRIAKQILDDGYLPIQQECRAKFTQAVEGVEKVWADFQQFASETGLELHGYHREGLKIIFMQPTRQLRLALEKWI